MNETHLVWVVLGTAALVLTLGATVSVAALHERIVVTRFGRPVRVKGPGLVLRWPGLERLTTVSLYPVEVPVTVRARTSDGVDVSVVGHATFRITEPSRIAAGDTDPLGGARECLDQLMAKEVNQVALADLLRCLRAYDSRLPAVASAATAVWGVEVTELAVSDIEARLTYDTLLRAGQQAMNDGGTAFEPGIAAAPRPDYGSIRPARMA